MPILSLTVAAAFAGGIALFGKLGLVAQVTDFSVYIVFVAVNLSVVVLRWRRPALARPIKSPFAIGKMPMLPILGLGSVGVLLPALDVEALMAGTGVCGAGLAAGLFLDSRSPVRRKLRWREVV